MRRISILHMTTFLILLLISIVGLRGEEHSYSGPCSLELNGVTDTMMLEEIEEINCASPVLDIASTGGEGRVGLEIARVIRTKKASIIVDEHCLSSCSEFLLAGAESLRFEDAPLIGFHGNPAMKEWLARGLEAPGVQNCAFEEVDLMYDLYFESNMNLAFWQKQLDALQLLHFGVDEASKADECPRMGFNFQHEMWFPSSATLRNDLGLEFTGTVCADDVAACTVRVQELFPNRGTFVIDDVIVDTGSQSQS